MDEPAYLALPEPAAGPAGPADWLILATDGPSLRLPALLPDVRLRFLRRSDELAAALRSYRPRLVLVTTPPAGPADLALVARERRRRSRVRVVLLDQPEAIQERLHALELGFDEAFPVSMDAVELAGRLTLLKERASAPSTSARLVLAEGLELDLAGRELRRDGRPVHLRPREYALLALLATHPGRAYTRRQLLGRLWGTHRRVDPRNVDVHIRWLREKVEDRPDHPLRLVTVRGIGYRLDPDR